MKTTTRTFPTRGRKTLLGRFFRLPAVLLAVPLLIAGIAMRLTTLIIPALLLLCCSLTLWAVRNRTVVTLNEKGIYYQSPFRKLHFTWQSVKSAGVYYTRRGQVFETAPFALPPATPARHTIYLSTRKGYSPLLHGRLVTSTDIHFRWNAAAWAAITAKCGAAIRGTPSGEKAG